MCNTVAPAESALLGRNFRNKSLYLTVRVDTIKTMHGLLQLLQKPFLIFSMELY